MVGRRLACQLVRGRRKQVLSQRKSDSGKIPKNKKERVPESGNVTGFKPDHHQQGVTLCMQCSEGIACAYRARVTIS